MSRILKNPITYFFVLGLVVFGLHSFLNKEKTERENAKQQMKKDTTK